MAKNNSIVGTFAVIADTFFLLCHRDHRTDSRRHTVGVLQPEMVVQHGRLYRRRPLLRRVALRHHRCRYVWTYA